MKYFYRIVFLAVLLLTAYYQFYDRLPSSLRKESPVSPNTPSSSATPAPPSHQILSDEEIVRGMALAFASKYDRPATDFTLKVAEKDATHARGSVQFNDGFTGGIWFGALSSGKWLLVFDGNGIVNCQIADQYSFTTEMIPQCIDTESGNELVNR